MTASVLSIDALPAIPRPGRVLLTQPDHFEVAYVINPHMKGNVGDVDRARAHAASGRRCARRTSASASRSA